VQLLDVQLQVHLSRGFKAAGMLCAAEPKTGTMTLEHAGDVTLSLLSTKHGITWNPVSSAACSLHKTVLEMLKISAYV
jgi:hypothetical protein